MILPTKHLPPRRSLIGIGGLLIQQIDRPRTVTSLWDASRLLPDVGSFERFVLALDFLFAIGAVSLKEGMLTRVSK
jgi:hypothetical protein